LNDENDRKGFAAGKSVIKATGKGNENIQLAGKQSLTAGKASLKTPSGRYTHDLVGLTEQLPGPRAPLGQKTTNAKTKGHQAPKPLIEENDLAKAKQRSASARRKGPRMSHAEPVRIDVLSDKHPEDDLDIGVIHPRPKDLPDTPDDLPDIDLSFLEGNFAAKTMEYIYNQPGRDGLSLLQRKQMKQAEELRMMEAHDEAIMKRSIDLHAPPPCMHEPLCPGDECKDEPERQRRIEEEYQRALESIFGSQKQPAAPSTQLKAAGAKARSKALVSKSTIVPPKPTQQPARSGVRPTAPSASLSKAAASRLAARPPITQVEPTRNRAADRRTPIYNANKATAGPKTTAPGPFRHAAATQVSRTTMGYAQGRVMSGEKRRSILPKQGMDAFQPPAASDEKLEHNREVEVSFREMLFEDALDDFQLEVLED
jgi:hypothetical protein